MQRTPVQMAERERAKLIYVGAVRDCVVQGRAASSPTTKPKRAQKCTY